MSKLLIADASTTSNTAVSRYFYKGNFIGEINNIVKLTEDLNMFFQMSLLSFKMSAMNHKDKLHKVILILYFTDANTKLLKNVNFRGYRATTQSGHTENVPLGNHKFAKEESNFEFDGVVDGSVVIFDITKLVNSVIGTDNVSLVITNDYVNTDPNNDLYVIKDLPNGIDSVKFFVTTIDERISIENNYAIQKRVGLCDIVIKKGIPTYTYELFRNQHLVLSVQNSNDYVGVLGSGLRSNLDYGNIFLDSSSCYFLDPAGYYRFFTRMSLEEANLYFEINEPNETHIYVDVYTQAYIVGESNNLYMKSRGRELKIVNKKVVEYKSDGVTTKYGYTNNPTNPRLNSITRNNKLLDIEFRYDSSNQLYEIEDYAAHQKTRITYTNGIISKIELVKVSNGIEYYIENTSIAQSGTIINDEKRNITYSRESFGTGLNRYTRNTITDGIDDYIDIYNISSAKKTTKTLVNTTDYYYDLNNDVKFYAVDGRFYSLKYSRSEKGINNEFSFITTPLRNNLDNSNNYAAWNRLNSTSSHILVMGEEIIDPAIEIKPNNGIYQELLLGGNEGEELVFSCFLNGDFKKNSVKLIIQTYNDNNILLEAGVFYFDYLSRELQYFSGCLVTQESFSKVKFIVENNSSYEVLVGLMSLYKSDVSNSGDYIELQDFNGVKINTNNPIVECDENNMISTIISEDREMATYQYDNDGKLEVINNHTSNQINTNTYEGGNLVAKTIEKNGRIFTNNYEYDTADNLIRTIDAFGNKMEFSNNNPYSTIYNSDKSGVISKYGYSYDDKLSQSSFLINESDISNDLTYIDENIDEVLGETSFKFNYDNHKRLSNILMDNKQLLSQQYHTVSGHETALISRKQYGTNASNAYTFEYDNKLRTEKVKYNSTMRYGFEYNDFDRLQKIIYYYMPQANKSYTYYDNGLLKEINSDIVTNNPVKNYYTFNYKYDNLNGLQEANYLYDNKALKVEYDYNYEKTRISRVYKDLYLNNNLDVITLRRDYRTYKNQLPIEKKNITRTVDENLKQAVLCLEKKNSQLSYDVKGKAKNSIGIYAWMKIPSSIRQPILWIKNKDSTYYYAEITQEGITFNPALLRYPEEAMLFTVPNDKYSLVYISVESAVTKVRVNDNLWEISNDLNASDIESVGFGNYAGNQSEIDSIKLLSGGIVYDKTIDGVFNDIENALLQATKEPQAPNCKTTFTYNNIESYCYNEFDDNERLRIKNIKHQSSNIMNEIITYDDNDLPIKVTGNNYETHYAYDEIGNITHKVKFDNNKLVVEAYYYEYDNFKRLIKEIIHKELNVIDKTIIYSYDNKGNITSKTINNDSTFFSYDGILLTLIEKETGVISNSYSSNNPLYPSSYNNNNLIWEGNRLYSYGSNYFKYDEKGYRTRKVVGSNTIDYILDGSRIIFEKRSNDSSTITYKYDINGQLIGFDYGLQSFYYLRDITGIIEGITDAYGNLVSRYRYDAYGNHQVLDVYGEVDTNMTSIGHINAIRYKGYYYDVETNLYYLNSRYYDPKVGRFISPDSVEYLDPESINGLNLYAYCRNNPVMYLDRTGHSWESFWKVFTTVVSIVAIIGGTVLIATGIGGILGGVLIGAGSNSLLNGYMNEKNGGSYFAGWLGGAIGGAISGAFPLGIGRIIGNGIGTTITSFATDILEIGFSNKEFNFLQSASKSLISGGISMLTSWMIGGAFDGAIQFMGSSTTNSISSGVAGVAMQYVFSIFNWGGIVAGHYLFD